MKYRKCCYNTGLKDFTILRRPSMFKMPLYRNRSILCYATLWARGGNSDQRVPKDYVQDKTLVKTFNADEL